MRVSLTKKIFLNFLILSIVPILIIDTYFYYKSKEALINRTFDQLTTVRIEKQNRLTYFFSRRFHFLDAVSRIDSVNRIFYYLNHNDTIPTDFYLHFNKTVSLINDNNNLCSKILWVSMNSQKRWIWDLKHKKQTICDEEQPETKIIKAVIRKSLHTKGPVIYDEKNDFSTKSHSIFMAHAVFSKNQQRIGTVVLEISLNAINKIMYENNPHNGLGKTGETYLVGDDYYMRSSSRFKDNSIFKIKVETDGVKQAFSGVVGTKQILDYRQVPVLSSFSKIAVPELNWAILAEIDVQEAMIPIYLIRNDIIFMSIILSILLLGLVELLSSKITAPLKKLKQATDKISSGQTGIPVDAGMNDEIGDLIIAFNKMTKQLNEQSARLEEERILRTKSLFDGQEMERQRLSRELHDSLGQSILAVKIKFEQIEGASVEKKNKIVAETKEMFQKIMTEIRNISNNLMPAVLSEFGLLLALKKTCREFEKQTGISITLKIKNQQETFDRKLEIYVYRIVQESFNNIIKHADATAVKLFFIERKHFIYLTIQDNGIGFNIDEVAFLKGNGLYNIKERMRLLNGEINIFSAPEKGTRILCIIPKHDHYKI